MTTSVVSLWATRRSIDAGLHAPDLLVAWDEFTIDENTDGWFKECREALDAMGDDLDQFRYITLRVDHGVLYDAFFHSVSADVQATVTPEAGPS